MKTWAKITIGTFIVTAAGTMIFLGTRKAAAADDAARGFAIGKDCARASVTDEKYAKSSVFNAALISLQGMDEPAEDLLMRVLGTMWPQCAGKFTDAFTIDVPGMPPMTLGAIKVLMAGKTVGELKAAYESGKFDKLGATPGTRDTNQPDFLLRAIFVDAPSSATSLA